MHTCLENRRRALFAPPSPCAWCAGVVASGSKLTLLACLWLRVPARAAAAVSGLPAGPGSLARCLSHTAAAQPEQHRENARTGVHARGLALDHPHAHHPAMPRAAVRLLIDDGIHLLIAFSSFSMNCSSCISPSSSR